jgi:predicted nucleotidyltransferase
MNTLAQILGSQARSAVFRLLFSDPKVELYLREIERKSALSIGAIQREVGLLLEIGLISSRKDGNRLYYRANGSHPLFPEIRALVEKTSGYQGVLRDALSDPDIQCAFVFGSMAAGKARAESDLDLFVVGRPGATLGLRKVTRLLVGCSDRIGRVINPHVMSAEEFTQKFRKKDHFVSSVLASKKVVLIGDLKFLESPGA